jgi:hypothetical protein
VDSKAKANSKFTASNFYRNEKTITVSKIG